MIPNASPGKPAIVLELWRLSQQLHPLVENLLQNSRSQLFYLGKPQVDQHREE
jgi:hypothetical protein